MSIISTINHIPNSRTFLFSSLSILSLPSSYLHQTQQNPYPQQRRYCCAAIKTGSQEPYSPDLLKKPDISQQSSESSDEDDSEKFERVVGDVDKWIDWEDQILEDTVPLVGFVRMILHSGKYQSGDRLSAEHERTILERLLPYHPEYEKKIGCGVDYITIGYHPQFQDSRCMFIVRKDGELVDFSYWKCIKGLIRKNYPLYADSFILKHFRRRKRYE
ncbi:protein DCL, chloroplastic [Amaranthus tricolor]|uniref:protein DCL, chloroplastic n=1 Tax=Amaranthus tricolor TaxID=29722 RepID=UPI00258876B6|nr:protein DCL, chloroplastic [Amaranthus tricolor]